MRRKRAVSVVYIIKTKKAKLHELHISLSLLVQPALHLHNGLQWSPARWHLQLPLQATTQPHWRSSEQALLTSDKSIQYGTHWLVLAFHSQPQSLGFGISRILERDCFQTNPAVWRARLACWKRAFWVGGMESRDLRPWVNISFLASLTDYYKWITWDLKCYKNTNSFGMWPLYGHLVNRGVARGGQGGASAPPAQRGQIFINSSYDWKIFVTLTVWGIKEV